MAVLLAAAPAEAQDIPLANGNDWDIDAFGGDIDDGGQDSFDSWGDLDVEVADGAGTSLGTDDRVGDLNVELDAVSARRAAATTPVAVGGVEVSRSYYAPAGTNYIRFLDSFTNTTTETRVVSVVWGGDLGSDSDTLVAATSSGDRTFDASDEWGVTIDADDVAGPADDGPVGYSPGSGDALVMVVDEDSGPGTAWSGDGDDDIGFHYVFEVPAGETRYLMYFLYMGLAEDTAAPGGGGTPASGSQIAETIAEIRALTLAPDIADLDAAVVATIVNWDFPPRTDGSTCFDGAQCSSTFCVDGVCCNSSCGGGVDTDCEACSVAAGGTVDGSCGPAASTHVCRPPTDLCDAAETCDGSSLTCPADAVLAAGEVCRPSFGACDQADTCDGSSSACANEVLAAGTVCRAASGACDVDEACTGDSVSCPADEFVAAGTECRAATGSCDLAESCRGDAPTCPPDARIAAGVVCREATGPCDAAETCSGSGGDCPADVGVEDGTACGDDMVCNGTEVCTSGTCVAPGDLDCDDGDPCTADMCFEPDGCANEPIAGCCTADAACDDGDVCTMDSCVDNACVSEEIPDCGAGSDAGPGDEDAGVVADGAVGSDAGTDVRPRDDGGCGCSAPGASPTGPATGLIALLGLGLWLRRRRR